ncbi:MAG: hypothetical protein KDK48_06830, partial [Chlamydiia bacterium]|nr:hypothetical protein [Chlamydiia bacterium]
APLCVQLVANAASNATCGIFNMPLAALTLDSGRFFVGIGQLENSVYLIISLAVALFSPTNCIEFLHYSGVYSPDSLTFLDHVEVLKDIPFSPRVEAEVRVHLKKLKENPGLLGKDLAEKAIHDLEERLAQNAKPKPKPKPETKPKPKPKPEAKPEAKPKPETKPEQATQPEAHSKPEAKPEQATQPAIQPEANPNPRARSASEPLPFPKPKMVPVAEAVPMPLPTDIESSGSEESQVTVEERSVHSSSEEEKPLPPREPSFELVPEGMTAEEFAKLKEKPLVRMPEIKTNRLETVKRIFRKGRKLPSKKTKKTE